MTLSVQQALQSGAHTLETLERDLAIKAVQHESLPLVLLKYDQIASPKLDPFVRECRGLILERDTWSVVCRGFDRFFNYGEPGAADIDWSSATVQEKLDGSLLQLYRYGNDWHVATKGTPDASGNVNGHGRFSDYAIEAIEGTAPDLWRNRGDILDPRFCYLFELTGPQNRVVVRHERPGVTLIGARYLDHGCEVPASAAWGLLGGRIPHVRSFPLRSADDALATFQSLSPLEQEGYVVVDRSFRRVKVKHPGYVALHHTIGSYSPRNMLELIRRGEADEVMAAFPELPIRDLLDRYEQLIAECERDLTDLGGADDMKAFALQATKRRMPSALFAVKRGLAGSVREFLAGLPIKSLAVAVGGGADDDELKPETGIQ